MQLLSKTRDRLALSFCILGLAVGAVIGATVGWTVHAPKSAPAVPTINVNLTTQQLLKRLGPPSNVISPSAKSGGYTVVQFESHDRAADGTPSWIANIGVK